MPRRIDDLGACESLGNERKFIEDQLLAARGLHGRTRSLQDPLKATRDRVRAPSTEPSTESASTTPTSPNTSKPLSSAARTWSYRPTPPVDWIV